MIIKLRNFGIPNSIEKFIVKADGIVVSHYESATQKMFI